MISVIIAAAGTGSRMGGGVKKQYRQVENLPVLVKTVKAFCAFGENFEGENFEIVIAGPKDDLEYIKGLVPNATVVAGGSTRGGSVRNALASVKGDMVLVHDAARCFVGQDVIGRVVYALKNGADAVIPCVQPKSTIRTMDSTLDRSKLFEVQTPQGFKTDVLKKAFEKAAADGFEGTDEGSITDHFGILPEIVEGSYANIKITTEEDMPKDIRTGQGYDVHRMAEGRKLMLGCVEVPYERGLLGHSDADVLSHAIADALLGACGLRDIGYYFPDNAAETEGLPGRVLLEKTNELVKNAGFGIVNIDATIVAQKPKLAPYIEEMKRAVAGALDIDVSCVGIKATTEEGLGITGSGDAMAAYAVASVK